MRFVNNSWDRRIKFILYLFFAVQVGVGARLKFLMRTFADADSAFIWLVTAFLGVAATMYYITIVSWDLLHLRGLSMYIVTKHMLFRVKIRSYAFTKSLVSESSVTDSLLDTLLR